MNVPPTSPPRLATLILLAAMAILPLNIFLPSLPGIAADFQADYALVNLMVAGYVATSALLHLIVGPLSDRFGRRPVILVGLAIFVLASSGCALSTDIRAFLVLRMLQAAVVAGYAVSLAVTRDSFDASASASRIGYIAMAFAVAPMLGPMLGGGIDELFGWRANFWAVALFGVALLALCWIDLGETNKAPSATLVAQIRAYPQLLRSTRFWAFASCLAFSTGAFYGFLGGAPLVATSLFGMSPTVLGLAMGSTAAGFVLGSFVSARNKGRYALWAMMLAGRLVACVGLSVGLILFLAGIVHPLSFFGACMCVGIGNGLTMPSANAGAMSVRPELAGSAAGLTSAMTSSGGAVISSIAGAIVTSGSGAVALLGVMLFSSTAALVAALYLYRSERGIADHRQSSRPRSP